MIRTKIAKRIFAKKAVQENIRFNQEDKSFDEARKMQWVKMNSLSSCNTHSG
jgi:hypothetical protein